MNQPGKIKEDARREVFPLLILLDGQGEHSLKSKQKDRDGKIPIVRVALHGYNPVIQIYPFLIRRGWSFYL